jgi:hypothetical protein
LSEANAVRNIYGIVPVAKLDGDEIGFHLGRVAEIKRRD